MTTDPTLLAIIHHLQSRHDCHTILLYGSRARASSSPTSDYDIMALSDRAPARRDTAAIAGADLDVWIYPDAAAMKNESLILLRDAIVLCERDGAGVALIRMARERYAAGPTPIADDELAHRERWCRRTLLRMRRRAPDDPEGAYRRVWLLQELLPWWFEVRRLWYPGSRVAFDWLAANHPRSHAAFKSALRPGEVDTEIERLIDEVFSVGGRSA